MKTILTFAILLSFIFSSYSQISEELLQKTIDSIYTANPESIGIIVHVESPDKNISWSGTAGYTSKNMQNKIGPNQPVLIASNTKTYISATILRLVEKDKIEINQSIKKLISNKTRKLFESEGYNLESITLAHLLSHTSGIPDYVNKDFVKLIVDNPKYRWTRDEQLEFALKTGNLIDKPGEVFSYADANYVLLTEVIEHLTDQHFYTAMKELLMYKALKLENTWFPSLEEKPANSKPLVHQYYSSKNFDSYTQDPSWETYGGGGIACTMNDLAKFTYNLFNFNIIKDTATFNLIFTKIDAKNVNPPDYNLDDYRLGINGYEYGEFKGYGHEGFWGTIAVYFPELNTSIAVSISEKDQRKLIPEIIERLIVILKVKD